LIYTDITMVMESMDTHKRYFILHGLKFQAYILFLSGLVITNDVFAFDWRLRPSLSMSEVFTDNLQLSENAKKSGFISEVAPGISMQGISPWSNMDLNYRLQGLYNAGGRDAVDINHQLQFNSLYQALRNTLFLQTSSSISQQNSTNSFIATDNLTGNNNRVETKNFSVSPYWTPRFGQYASGLFKIGYNKSTFDNVNSSLGANTDLAISDSESFIRQANLTSGSKFNTVRWNLGYSSNEQSRTTGNDVLFEQYQGDARYFINRKYNVFFQGGYENNDYQTLNNSISNGFFYTFGGQWSPSQYYSLEAGYGNNRHVTVRYNPSTNLTSNITYRNKSVGLNEGDSWDANFNYRIKQAIINFTYSQETTTVQNQLLQLSEQFRVFDQNNIDPLNPLLNLNSPNFVDSVIISKNARLGLNYATGKSTYNAAIYNTRRSYELSANDQQDDVYGASAGWQWQFQPRLNFYLQPTWQTIDNSTSSNQRYDIALGLSRAIPINLGRPLTMNTRLEFRHINQKSDLSTNDFMENRATANFAVLF
jgi:uncharacterized protein (PEP-CTERM system associated)